MCFVGSHDQLPASAWTRLGKELQEGVAEVWVQTPIQFVNHKNLATRGEMIKRRQQIQTSLRSVGFLLKRNCIRILVHGVPGGQVSPDDLRRVLRMELQ